MISRNIQLSTFRSTGCVLLEARAVVTDFPAPLLLVIEEGVTLLGADMGTPSTKVQNASHKANYAQLRSLHVLKDRTGVMDDAMSSPCTTGRPSYPAPDRFPAAVGASMTREQGIAPGELWNDCGGEHDRSEVLAKRHGAESSTSLGYPGYCYELGGKVERLAHGNAFEGFNRHSIERGLSPFVMSFSGDYTVCVYSYDQLQLDATIQASSDEAVHLKQQLVSLTGNKVAADVDV